MYACDFGSGLIWRGGPWHVTPAAGLAPTRLRVWLCFACCMFAVSVCCAMTLGVFACRFCVQAGIAWLAFTKLAVPSACHHCPQLLPIRILLSGPHPCQSDGHTKHCWMWRFLLLVAVGCGERASLPGEVCSTCNGPQTNCTAVRDVFGHPQA